MLMQFYSNLILQYIFILIISVNIQTVFCAVNTPIAGLCFSSPRFIWLLLASQKQLSFPRLADVKAPLVDYKSPFTHLCQRPNVLRTSKQQSAFIQVNNNLLTGFYNCCFS